MQLKCLRTYGLPLLAALLWGAAGMAQAQPVVLKDIRLQDQRGQSIEPASFKGRALLLNFVFTGCSATCPLQTRELGDVVRSLPPDVRAHLRLLSVSVDPLSDTPKTLAAFALRHDANLPGWRFATGEPQQVDLLIERMVATDPRKTQRGTPRRPEDHRTSLWLYDAAGALVQRYAGAPVDRVRLAEEITQLVRRAAP
jgi:protein SCO1/2